jgi:hypothetical protein
MLVGGPPLPVFQSLFRSSLGQLRRIKRDDFVEELRVFNHTASVRLNAGRNRRMVEQVRTTLDSSTPQPVPNRAIADLLGISKAAVTNFRQGKETSKKVQTFFESLFHWCYLPAVTPRLVWHYTRQMAIDSMLMDEPSNLSFATFLKIHFLSTQLDRWSLCQAQADERELQKLENHAGVQAVNELSPLLASSEYFETQNLQDLVPSPNVLDDFVKVGPLCLSFDLRMREIFDEVSK